MISRFMFFIVSNVIVPVGFMSGLAASDYCGKKKLKECFQWINSFLSDGLASLNPEFGGIRSTFGYRTRQLLS